MLYPSKYNKFSAYNESNTAASCSGPKTTAKTDTFIKRYHSTTYKPSISIFVFFMSRPISVSCVDSLWVSDFEFLLCNMHKATCNTHTTQCL